MSAPIPLPNQGGGDNTMLIAGLVACCCSSSIGGGIFAFLRMRGARAKAAETKRVSRPRPRPSNIRSDGGAARLARERRSRAQKAARLLSHSHTAVAEAVS